MRSFTTRKAVACTAVACRGDPAAAATMVALLRSASAANSRWDSCWTTPAEERAARLLAKTLLTTVCVSIHDEGRQALGLRTLRGHRAESRQIRSSSNKNRVALGA